MALSPPGPSAAARPAGSRGSSATGGSGSSAGAAPARGTPGSSAPRSPEQPGCVPGNNGGGNNKGVPRPPRIPGAFSRPQVDAAGPGQGLRYLEHICQMLERVARLQQDNRLLRQQAAGARRAGSVVRVRAEGWGLVGFVGCEDGVPAHALPLLARSPTGSRIRPRGGVRGSGRARAPTAMRQVRGAGVGVTPGSVPILGALSLTLSLSPACGFCPQYTGSVPNPTSIPPQPPTPRRAAGDGCTPPAPPACWTPPRAGRAPPPQTR